MHPVTPLRPFAGRKPWCFTIVQDAENSEPDAPLPLCHSPNPTEQFRGQEPPPPPARSLTSARAGQSNRT